MWKWECGSTVEQYQEMCVRYYEWFGLESQEESKKAVEMTSIMDERRKWNEEWRKN